MARSNTRLEGEARRLLERLPDDLTWDELMHEIYVRQSIEDGLADCKAGKVIEVKDVRERFGLPSQSAHAQQTLGVDSPVSSLYS